MAALIGKVDSVRGNTVHRLGHHEMHVQAAAWRTFVDTYLYPDGSGFTTISQNGRVIQRWEWEAEAAR